MPSAPPPDDLGPEATRARLDALATLPRDPEMERAATLVRWLDQRFLDPIIGLVVPEVGDLLTSVAGLYLVVIALRRKLPAVVIARMLLNLGIDALIGAVPLVGDAFDFAFRANTRNLALLEARYEAQRAQASDWVVMMAAVVFLVAALAIPLVLVGWILSWVFGSRGTP